MRSFHGIIALRSSHIGSKMNGTCPMINSDLHIIMPHTIHDDPLKCEGIGELGQAQKPWKTDALVDLSHLLQQPDKCDFPQGWQILLQSWHVIRLLDHFQGWIHMIAQFQGMKFNFQVLVQILERLSCRLDHSKPGSILDQTLSSGWRLQTQQNCQPCHFLLWSSEIENSKCKLW